ncbi:MAG: family 16 glycoside hydrolase [candidate division KSB1 bacterium]|nr:family 16 glycoside hydrolase [candidate division KSB1 bacterium]
MKTNNMIAAMRFVQRMDIRGALKIDHLILYIAIHLILFSALTVTGQPAPLSDYRWTLIKAENEDKVTGRHENAFVEYQGKFYLLGGRGVNPVNVFDPQTHSWKAKGKSPLEIHHFQAVVYGDAVYLMGAMTGGYPREHPLQHIWMYYPQTDTWKQGAEIPENRRRGGAGAVLYNDKIYLVGGIKFGHTSGTTNSFDSYDLKTGEWDILTDAPHIRDHFPAVVVDDKLYCIGGRNTSVHHPDNFGAFFSATVPQVDYYDFKEEKWFTLKEPLPVPTAAGGMVSIGTNLIYMGGEASQAQAYNQTQCLDLSTGTWTQLAPLSIGRHGSSAILYENNIYTAAGSPNKGGGNMTSIEVFSADHEWQSLFNGETLDGWQVKCREKDKDQTFWSVDDGAIYCNSLGSTDHGYVWLQNEKEYSDFELRLKFKVSRQHRGNSGVQIRSRYDDKAVVDEGGQAGWLDGPQVDIEPQNPWRNGFIYDETRDTRRWIHPSLPDWKIDKETYAPKRVIYYWEDEETGWNDMTIICRGTHIKTRVNNVVVSDYDGAGVLDDNAHQKYKVGMRGHIALQLHKNSQNKIWFKDIELRELK